MYLRLSLEESCFEKKKELNRTLRITLFIISVAVVIGEYFNEWNTSHNRYERTIVTSLGVELFCVTMLMYAVWWLYFDNMNLAIADNDNHHLLLAWLHLNLLMCVNESTPSIREYARPCM